MPSSRGSSQPRDGSCISCVSCIGRRILYLLCLGIFFLFSEPGLWILCVIAIQLNSTHDFCYLLVAAVSPPGIQLVWLSDAEQDSSMNKKIQKGFSSDQFSHSVMSDSLQPHGLQHTRPHVHHPIPEFTRTHVHRVGDAIQPPHPLSSPSPPAFNLSQHQGLFQ